jgi:hypothetical protein
VTSSATATEIAAACIESDWKHIAEEAWNAPSWQEAARQYHEQQPKTTPVAGRSWQETCRLADRKHNGDDPKLLRARRLLGDNVTLDAAWRELNDPRNRPTPRVTIEVIMYCVRERGAVALKEPANVERLSRCDQAAKAEINRRIARLGK